MSQLNVRITQKIDTYENWMKDTSLLLEKGEIAIAEIPSGDKTGLTPPAIGIKIGDGAKKFSELPWIQATAGDVYDWAKAEVKPEYTADEISGLSEYISGEIQDTNTTYQFSYENDTLIIKSKEKTETDYPTDESKWIKIPITVSTKVDKDTDAVAGNLAQFVEGGNVVDSGEKISDFMKTSAADGKYATKTELGELEGEITTIKSDLSGLSGAMHFKDEATKNPLEMTAEDLEVYASGDVVLYGNKEYVYNGTSFIELGDVTAEAQRISDLETAVGDASKGLVSDVAALKSTVGDASDGLVKDVATNAENIEKNATAISNVKATADSAVQSISGVTATKSGTDVAVTAVPVSLLTNVEGDTLIINCGTSTGF